MERSRTSRACVATAISLLFSGTAGAQTGGERAERVALLRQADAARSAGHLEEALALAQRAERVGVTAGTRLFVSQVNLSLRRWVAARDGAEECLRAVESDTQTSAANRRALHGECVRVLDGAQQYLGRLMVNVPANAPRSMVVRVNGEVLQPGLFNLDRTVDAGRVAVSATLDGALVWQREVMVGARSRTSVTVVVPAMPELPRSVGFPALPTMLPTTTPHASGAPQTGSARTVLPGEDRPGSTQRTLGWVSVGTGAALALGAAVAGGVFLATEGDYADRQCEVIAPNDNCQSIYGRFRTLNTLQWIGYVAGGVLVGTGGILLLTAPRRDERLAPTVGLSAGPGVLGGSLSGRF